MVEFLAISLTILYTVMFFVFSAFVAIFSLYSILSPFPLWIWLDGLTTISLIKGAYFLFCILLIPFIIGFWVRVLQFISTWYDPIFLTTEFYNETIRLLGGVI